MGLYAKNTSVSSDSSRAEIERTLKRYGASHIGFMQEPDRAVVAFRMRERLLKFVLALPSIDDKRFWVTPSRRKRRDRDAAMREWEKACRQSWRALALVIKAKLEAVEGKITEFDSEFLAHIVLPNGRTAGEVVVPQIAAAYESGATPRLMLEA